MNVLDGGVHCGVTTVYTLSSHLDHGMLRFCWVTSEISFKEGKIDPR